VLQWNRKRLVSSYLGPGQPNPILNHFFNFNSNSKPEYPIIPTPTSYGLLHWYNCNGYYWRPTWTRVTWWDMRTQLPADEPRKIGTTTTTTTAGQAPTQPKWQVAAEFIKCPGELHSGPGLYVIMQLMSPFRLDRRTYIRKKIDLL
jgi:hypothetical protein